MKHPRKGVLRAYHDGELPDPARRRTSAHLAECRKCRRCLEGIVRDARLCTSALGSLGPGALPELAPRQRSPGTLRPTGAPFGWMAWLLRPLPVPAPVPLAVIAILLGTLIFPFGRTGPPGGRGTAAGRITSPARFRVGSTERVGFLKLPEGRYRPVREPEVFEVPGGIAGPPAPDIRPRTGRRSDE